MTSSEQGEIHCSESAQGKRENDNDKNSGGDGRDKTSESNLHTGID